MNEAWSLFPLGMNDAWLLPVACLLAFAVVALVTRDLPGRWPALPAVLAIGLGFAIFWFILSEFLHQGAKDFSFRWLYIPAMSLPNLEFEGLELRLGMRVDALAVLMLGVVTFVAFCIQVYSLGYMRGEARFGWYYAAMSLFATAMLVLVLADNLLLLYIAWELVGLCSYLLIGFYYERQSAAEAAKKAFVTTRLGDVGFLIGIFVLWKTTGSFSIGHILEMAEAGGIAAGTMTAAALLLFLGAMGKSAQFPFHVWLPDAMEGPTPVSALIHAATMVAAGVYMVARMFPLFEAAPYALSVVTVIGLITAVMAATMAIVMTDLKRVLAYSTISQLGFMMLALGSFGYAAAMFHLFTHAFFKALLFLGAGSVIHATEENDIRAMGGLWRRMPVTAVLFVIASLALAGLPPLAGFFSKDEILHFVREHQNPLVLALTVVAALMSAFYMTRLFIVVFFGRPGEATSRAHESPWVMTVPMALLGVMAVVGGWAAFDWVGPLFRLPSQFAGFGTFLYLPSEGPERYQLDLSLALGSTVVALTGIALGWAFYSRRLWSTANLQARFTGLHRLLVSKYYMDDAYQAIIDRVVLAFAGFIGLFDRVVVNDTGVNGTGRLTALAGKGLRYHETGKLYDYGLAMAGGAVIIVLIALPLLL